MSFIQIVWAIYIFIPKINCKCFQIFYFFLTFYFTINFFSLSLSLVLLIHGKGFVFWFTMAEFHLIISCYVDLALFFFFVCVCRNDICYLLFCGESGCPVVDQLIDIHSCIWFWFKVVMMSRFWPFIFIINNKKIFLERGKTSFTKDSSEDYNFKFKRSYESIKKKKYITF